VCRLGTATLAPTALPRAEPGQTQCAALIERKLGRRRPGGSYPSRMFTLARGSSVFPAEGFGFSPCFRPAFGGYPSQRATVGFECLFRRLQGLALEIGRHAVQRDLDRDRGLSSVLERERRLRPRQLIARRENESIGLCGVRLTQSPPCEEPDQIPRFHGNMCVVPIDCVQLLATRRRVGNDLVRSHRPSDGPLSASAPKRSRNRPRTTKR
jgi:hypothetical protein